MKNNTNVNNTNNNARNDKKGRYIALAVILALVFCISATGAIAFAAKWFDQTNKTDNTVTVDQPVIVSVGGAASNGTIMPGVDTSKVTTTFDVSITGTTGLDYKLVIKNIEFAFDPALAGSIKSDGYFKDKAELEALFGAGYNDFDDELNAGAFAAFLSEFKVSFNGGALASLAEGMILDANAVTDTGLTVSVSAADDLQLIARGGTLTFAIALEVA